MKSLIYFTVIMKCKLFCHSLFWYLVVQTYFKCVCACFENSKQDFPSISNPFEPKVKLPTCLALICTQTPHQLQNSSTSYASVIPLSFLPLCNSPEISKHVCVYMCVIFYSTHRSNGLLAWRLKEQWRERERESHVDQYTRLWQQQKTFSPPFSFFSFFTPKHWDFFCLSQLRASRRDEKEGGESECRRVRV